MSQKINDIIDLLEKKESEYFDKYVNDLDDNTADYFLFMGKTSGLGESITLIKKHFKLNIKTK